jgi:hypothetical protein
LDILNLFDNASSCARGQSARRQFAEPGIQARSGLSKELELFRVSPAPAADQVVQLHFQPQT